MKKERHNEMGYIVMKLFKEQPHFLTKKLLPWTICAFLLLAFIRSYFCPISPSLFLVQELRATASSSSPPPPPPQEEEIILAPNECDYTNGRWVQDNFGPLYNGTSCTTIKEGQNCMAHGRPDMGYLYWRWKPSNCSLPRFEPKTFLSLLRNRHLAFVGDSMARNQLESLLCMLATASTPNLVYTNGVDNKFRRWHFQTHNFTLSIYWSPFLVNGIEKSNDSDHNKLFLDSVDERWALDLEQMDMIVLSVGHWFLLPAVYSYGDSVLGCHFCPGQNYTEVGFYQAFGKALKTTLNAITERQGRNDRSIDVMVTTFSPHHFDGDWDKLGACSRTEPFKEGEKRLDGMDEEMRKNGVEEVEAAAGKANGKQRYGKRVRIEGLDVTKLALMRPDGHPGPYMHPFPFANGISERTQNDCVHWCLPGPVDTWNEILLHVIKRWESQIKLKWD